MRFVLVLGLLGTLGCSATGYAAAADREGNSIVAEKRAAVDAFRDDLVDPRTEDVARPPVPAPGEVPAEMSLGDAVSIGTRYSRDYETQREALFLSALDLSLTRRDFLQNVYSGSVSFTGTDGRRRDLADTTAVALSGTRFLPTGGRVTVSADGSIGSTDDGTGRDQVSTVTGTISITQPLLRGAGREVAFEPLTQGERDVVYAARDFELFRQRFAIDIERRYYDLVVLKRGLEITRRLADAQDRELRFAKARFRLRRGTQQDVLRAEQEHRDALNRVLDEEQNYDVELDRFKILLGLPIDVEFDIVDAIPEMAGFDVDLRSAVNAALLNRLDMLTSKDRVGDAERGVRVARNALLPGLDVDASYAVFSAENSSFNGLAFDDDLATFGLTLEIPLDRKSERNAYKASVLALEQARRDQREFEDNVILEVRDSLTGLRQQRQQVENERRNIDTIRRRVLRARLDVAAGQGSNRDVVEAQNDLAAASNSLNARVVSYYVTRLELLQRMGLLFVDKEGRIIP